MPDEAPLHRIVMVSLAGLSVEAGRKKRSGQITGGERVVRWAELELELELIQSHLTQKPMLRGEVDARALRV